MARTKRKVKARTVRRKKRKQGGRFERIMHRLEELWEALPKWIHDLVRWFLDLVFAALKLLRQGYRSATGTRPRRAVKVAVA